MKVNDLYTQKTYRLTLDFTVSINDEILQPSCDEDNLDDDSKQALQAQRALLKGLLSNKQGIDLLRKCVLEQARFEVGSDNLKDLLLIRNPSDESILDRLSGSHWEYFQEATDDERFDEVAGEAIYAIGVELEAASLVEVDETQGQDTAVRKKIEPLPLQDKDASSRFMDGIKILADRCK